VAAAFFVFGAKGASMRSDGDGHRAPGPRFRTNRAGVPDCVVEPSFIPVDVTVENVTGLGAL